MTVFTQALLLQFSCNSCLQFDAYIGCAEMVRSKLHPKMETEKELNLTDSIGCICVMCLQNDREAVMC